MIDMQKATECGLERYFTNLNWVSARVLREPEKSSKGVRKGAIILAMVDEVVPLFPKLRDNFYIVEWRGWNGMNWAKNADIKLVEDGSTLERTKLQFPGSICLDIGSGDFVDEDQFKPITCEKVYDAIQIASWSGFKRHDLLIEAAALIPSYKIIKFGHFPSESDEEKEIKKAVIRKSRDLGAHIEYPFECLEDNQKLPSNPADVNSYINSARIGILTSPREGMNRFKMECLSAGLPFLIPSDSVYPIKKHINSETGVVYEPTPEGLAEAIEITLLNLHNFDPRNYILRETGKTSSSRKLEGVLAELASRDESENHFKGISWDGRNQSLSWGVDALRLIEKYCPIEVKNGK